MAAAPTTAPPTVAAAQLALDELETEAANLPGQITATRRAGDTGAWMRLAQREEDLPAELDAARLALCRAQLDAAWQRAEAAAAAEAAAHTSLRDAEQARAEYRANFRVKARTAAEVSAIVATDAELNDAVTNAAHRHRLAQHAAAAELYEIGELERAIRDATGQAPPITGDGLQAPVHRLTVNISVYSPASYDPNILGSPAQQNAKPVTFAAGSRPPRWAAYQYLGRDGVWETE